MRQWPILFALLMCSIFTGQAQESSVFTQSADFFGPENPAALSAEEIRHPGRSIGVLARNQWWKTTNAGRPQTQALYYLENVPQKHLFGATFLADKIGATQQFDLQGRYAHTLAPGLKAGISAGVGSRNIAVSQLTWYDPDEPLLSALQETYWHFSVGTGLFYSSSFGQNSGLNWFAGAAWRYYRHLSQHTLTIRLPPQSQFYVQGGLIWNAWWLMGRYRYNPSFADALDLCLRRYIFRERFFVGVLVTSDFTYQTYGLQGGIEQLLTFGRTQNLHYLTASIGFSRPWAPYFVGNNLIFDARVTWSLERRPSQGSFY